MGSDREDPPDWLQEFQAPVSLFTTLSSDSDTSGKKSPASDDSFDDDEKISALKSSAKEATKRRLVVDDDTPVKRRKTGKEKKGESKDGDDIEREESPDKPRNTLAQNRSVWALSSDSESDSRAAAKDEAKKESSVHDLSDLKDEEGSDDEEYAPKTAMKSKTPRKKKVENVKATGKKKTNKPLKVEDAALKEEEAKDDLPTCELSEPVKEEEENDIEVAASRVTVKRKAHSKQAKVENVDSKIKETKPLELEGEVSDTDVAKEGISEKHVGSRASTSRLALVLPEKVSRTKALVECEGETIDLSGDVGAVGRVVISDTVSEEPEMLLDLKGTIYKTTIVPSRTFCVVSIGQSEAKIEAIMNDFIQLEPQSNVYDAETMVEGTVEGFSFDSEDEADKIPKDVKGDQEEGGEEKTTKKPKGKAEKKMGTTQKKGKAAAGKQPKKRKPQATKKGKGKK